MQRKLQVFLLPPGNPKKGSADWVSFLCLGGSRGRGGPPKPPMHRNNSPALPYPCISLGDRICPDFSPSSPSQILNYLFPRSCLHAFIQHFPPTPQQNCCHCPSWLEPRLPNIPSPSTSTFLLPAYQNLKMMPVATRTMMMEMVIVT